MHVDQLRYFADLAKTNSMNLTAQRMFVTQPTISEAIKRLERELDCTLLIRSNSGIEEFTEDGKEVLKFAQEVLLHYEQLMRYLQEKYQRDKLYGNLAIGVGYGIGASLLLPLILKCNRVYPGIKIGAIEGPPQMLLTLLDTGELDFVLIGTQDPAALFSENQFMKNFSYLELFQDPLVCAMHKNHPLSSFQSLTFEQLRDIPTTCFDLELGQADHINHSHVSTNIDIHRLFIYENHAVCLMPYQVYLAKFTDKNIICRPFSAEPPAIIHNYLFYRTASFAAQQTLYQEFITTTKAILSQSSVHATE